MDYNKSKTLREKIEKLKEHLDKMDILFDEIDEIIKNEG